MIYNKIQKSLLEPQLYFGYEIIIHVRNGGNNLYEFKLLANNSFSIRAADK